MAFPLRVRELGPWVVGYAVLGLMPRLALPYIPAEVLATEVVRDGERTLSIVDVAMWLPNLFAIAAVLTLVIGIVFAAGQGIIDPFTANGTRYIWIWSMFQQMRYTASIAGILIIVVCIVLVWLSIFRGDMINWINLILFGIAAGTGLATGAAYYR